MPTGPSNGFMYPLNKPTDPSKSLIQTSDVIIDINILICKYDVLLVIIPALNTIET